MIIKTQHNQLVMSDKRKPDFVLLLKKQGKTNKVELFNRDKFTSEPLPSRCKSTQYRLRVNGKWFNDSYYAGWQIMKMFWRGTGI